jgi:hypothetical protein
MIMDINKRGMDSGTEKGVEAIVDQTAHYAEVVKEDPNAPMPKPMFNAPISRGAGLKTLMGGIKREGKLQEVIRILQTAEKRLDEFKNDGIWWNILLPYPLFFQKSIKRLFNESEDAEVRDLSKHLYLSNKTVLSTYLYIISALTLVATISTTFIVLSFYRDYWGIPICLIFLLLLFLLIQVNVSNIVFQRASFLGAYENIYGVFEETYYGHLALVAKSAKLYQFMEEQELVLQQDLKLQDNKKELKRAELKAVEELKNLMLAAAFAQAEANAAAKMIDNFISLEYQEDLKAIETQNQCVLSITESLGRALVEQAKILAEEGSETRDINRMIDFANRIKGGIQSSGTGEFYKEGFNEILIQLQDFLTNTSAKKVKKSSSKSQSE